MPNNYDSALAARKQFFFEKKNQKTFALWRACCRGMGLDPSYRNAISEKLRSFRLCKLSMPPDCRISSAFSPIFRC